MKKKLITAFGLALAVMLTGLVFSRDYRQAVSSGEIFGVVVIDAGHGGEDGGAISLSGIKESNFNLEIALRLEQTAALLGLRPIMTRVDDSHLGGENFGKSEDIRARLAMVTANPGAILVSVHQNSYPDKRYGGAQMFYGVGEGSKELAQLMQDNMKAALDTDNDRKIKYAGDSVYLLNHCKGVAVLAECGFITNYADEAALQTPEYQKKTAMAIAAALTDYMTK